MKRLLNLIMVCLFFALSSTASDLTGKRIAILGDSMTWIGGDSCTNQRGWTSHFVNLTHPSAVDIYARSGATWTNTKSTKGDTSEYSEIITDENVIYSQVLRLLESTDTAKTAYPDIILIYAGANDAWFSSRRPGIFNSLVNSNDAMQSPSQCTSLASSVSLSCKMIQKEFPDARIILMTPVEMAKVPAAEVNRVAGIIEATAKDLGIEVFRMDLDVDIRHNVEKTNPRYTADGVHTNPEGARLIGEYVASRLMN